MAETPNHEPYLKDWNVKEGIAYVRERENNLLNLRYQLAFVVMTIIIGVWTILVGFISQIIKPGLTIDITFFFVFALLLSIGIIVFWRIFTHIINWESLRLGISRTISLNELGLIDIYASDNFTIERELNLTQYPKYPKSDSPHSDNTLLENYQFKKKLSIMKDVCFLTSDSGIKLFDIIAEIIVLILLEILVVLETFKIVNLRPDFPPTSDPIRIFIAILLIILAYGFHKEIVPYIKEIWIKRRKWNWNNL
jgi:hypothetical protein